MEECKQMDGYMCMQMEKNQYRKIEAYHKVCKVGGTKID